MASIQQALNQAFASALGITTAGAYLYRQSGHYQGRQAEVEANREEKMQENLLELYNKQKAGSPEEDRTLDKLDQSKERVEELREEALRKAGRGMFSQREKAYQESVEQVDDKNEANEMSLQQIQRRKAKEKEAAEREAIGRMIMSVNQQQEINNSVQERLDMLRQSTGGNQ